ncbi:lytic transglycosylase domain-containing protein [Paraburkholderia bonniea]|uniref:lytic transglycosylase domain-containing protein n=1 Tax=Paraburkholderia bonniea TaxID=2152891 RepID=UPI001FEBFEC1|nr:lytic transglycosylase domain-containing protein [Paraburkholderia bonniea]WJF89282.1 lytic transglycosylase domain-containing protein [Paraburkholderia bonniea]WJF92598.1 lytic transglycosylase domain-containing protein [Paraburkholderia bonniea]
MNSSVTMAAVLAALVAVTMPTAHAEVYACVAGDGARYMSNRQTDECYALVVGAPVHGAARGSQTVAARAGQSRLQPYQQARLLSGSRPVTLSSVSVAAAPRPARPLPNVQATWQRASTYGALIADAAQAYGVDPYLLTAVISVESGFNPLAVSPKGAVGLMQLIPATGMRYGIAGANQASVSQQLADPAANIHAGARYLSDLLRRYPGNLKLVLAAYNAGEGAVQKYNEQIPPYEETRAYVVRVLGHYQQLMDLPQGNSRHEIQ